jgi:hypothetical protein
VLESSTRPAASIIAPSVPASAPVISQLMDEGEALIAWLYDLLVSSVDIASVVVIMNGHGRSRIVEEAWLLRRLNNLDVPAKNISHIVQRCNQCYGHTRQYQSTLRNKTVYEGTHECCFEEVLTSVEVKNVDYLQAGKSFALADS